MVHMKSCNQLMAKVLHVNNFVFGRRVLAEIRVPPFRNYFFNRDMFSLFYFVLRMIIVYTVSFIKPYRYPVYKGTGSR